MKKTTLSLIALFTTLQFSYAQWSASGTHIYNTNSGNVGIGTTGPASLLTLSSTYATDIRINRASTKYARVLFSTDGTAKWYVGMDNDATPNTDAFVIEGPTAAHFTINPTGNVGIGTTTPTDKMDINGSLSLIGGNREIHFRDPSNVIKQYVWLNDNSSLGLGAGSESTSLFINSVGNVGIGTLAVPNNYKLAVNGAAIATSMKVQLKANWPDFVFLKDYKLPTLTEVKTYIDKNRHLPDMPSADEVHANGLDLGEMNRLLLKKVEELTLYLIEKDGQFNKLKKKHQVQQENNERQQAQLEELQAAVSALKAQSKK